MLTHIHNSNMYYVIYYYMKLDMKQYLVLFHIYAFVMEQRVWQHVYISDV